MTAPAIPADPNPYKPGDHLRVTIAQPYGSELVVGELVTVHEVATKVEPDHTEFPVVIVSTAHGQRILGLDAVEPADLPTYTPAEPDEIVNAQLAAMFAADPELADLFKDADTALGAVDDPVTERDPTRPADDADEECEESWEPGGPSSIFEGTDGYGDALSITYVEKNCPAHGRRSVLFFQTDGGASVMFPAHQLDTLMRYLYARKKHSERPGEV